MKIRTRDDDIRKWLHVRELGGKATVGLRSRLSRQLYSSVTKVRSWNPVKTVDHTHHGGIFNFDFSTDGSLLVAACEKRSILVFDPLNGKLILNKNNAHTDCVNCIKFLDSRLFATCSDDMTVCMWDVRYLKHKIRTLRGHTNWVKNIEYDSSSELLVTSGFDGNIYTWEINRYSEKEEDFTCVFHTTGLMRTKVTPDASKLIAATASGYLMVVHDLNLETLSQDLHGFKPNMYRRMEMAGPLEYQGSLNKYNDVFTRRRNRVELISDFPPENKAEMIASLEVHPQGWCAVSRNTSSDELSEWTCVHDIQSVNSPTGSETDAIGGNCVDDEPAAATSRASIGACPGTSELPARDTEEVRRLATPGQSPPTPIHTPQSSRSSRESSPAFFFSIRFNDSSNQPVAPTQPGTSDPQRQSYQVQVVRERSLVRPVDSLASHSSLFDLTSMFSPQPSVSIPTSQDDLPSSTSRQDISSRSEQGSQDTSRSLPSTDHRQVLGTSRTQDSTELTRPENHSGTSRTQDSTELTRPENHSRTDQDVGQSETRRMDVFTPPSTRRSVQSTRSVPQTTAAVFRIQRSPQAASDAGESGSVSIEPGPVPASPVHQRRPRPSSIIHPSSQGIQGPVAGMHLGDYVSLVFRSDSAISGPMWLMGENSQNKPPHNKMSYSRQRLTHYVEELNVGRGFIKEVSFSNDGRLICSPFGFGIRLLAFDPCCNEVCDVVPSSPVKLYELTTNMTHTSAVVTTKFSPHHCLIVSGCLSGKVDFHQPLL